jgi:hypothetical protein
MTRNDADDFAKRLYARVPAQYRVFDAELNQPLLVLLKLVGEQAANLRADLDNLWDDFFIETCEDWVVPYLAALVGTKLQLRPVGQSNRLDVRNTVCWRRSKGTPAMLQALVGSITGWTTGFAEFFTIIGWSQNVNHVRPKARLTVDIRHQSELSALGHAGDPWAHSVDIRSSAPLDQARVTRESLGVGQAAWGTPGRYQVKNVGFFVYRLQTFSAIRGATPAAARPGADAGPGYFTFDPLFRDVPLFVQESRKPITRAGFAWSPEAVYGVDKDGKGKDIVVYKAGTLVSPAIAVDLSTGKPSIPIPPGEVGIDPELGRFAFHPDDPLGADPSSLTVDYVEAFSSPVGARTYDRGIDPAIKPTRVVRSSGVAEGPPTHQSLKDALDNVSEPTEVIEIQDSATYAVRQTISFAHKEVKSLTIRAAPQQRPCLTFYEAEDKPLAASLQIDSELHVLELNGLLISGGPLTVVKLVQSLTIVGCTLDPLRAPPGKLTPLSLVSAVSDDGANAQYSVCRSIIGGVRASRGVGRLLIADSIVDRQHRLALYLASDTGAATVHLERVTVLGHVCCDVLIASECLLDEKVRVQDQQAGCIRFSRFEDGSILPRRFECVPSEAELAAPRTTVRCLAPIFNSRRFGRPDYVQLASACPEEILKASEEESEIGAFATEFSTIRLANLNLKLQEFLPVGLTALILAET